MPLLEYLCERTNVKWFLVTLNMIMHLLILPKKCRNWTKARLIQLQALFRWKKERSWSVFTPQEQSSLWPSTFPILWTLDQDNQCSELRAWLFVLCFSTDTDLIFLGTLVWKNYFSSWPWLQEQATEWTSSGDCVSQGTEIALVTDCVSWEWRTPPLGFSWLCCPEGASVQRWVFCLYFSVHSWPVWHVCPKFVWE